jgi:hypothetical protein
LQALFQKNGKPLEIKGKTKICVIYFLDISGAWVYSVDKYVSGRENSAVP